MYVNEMGVNDSCVFVCEYRCVWENQPTQSSIPEPLLFSLHGSHVDADYF